MIYMPTSHLKSGMKLARDLYGLDSTTSKIVMLRSRQTLGKNQIKKLKQLNIHGAYIETSSSSNIDIELPVSIKPETRDKVFESIVLVYDMCSNSTAALTSGALQQANDVIANLVDEISCNPNMYLDISKLKLYDDYTYNHSLGVTVITVSIGLSMGFSRDQLINLVKSALLHDIGKTQIPIEIIGKTGPLTSEEYEVVKEHALLGVDILKDSNLPQCVLDGIASHHERFDGTGYPYKLKGADIPIFGRIIACADVYDALTSNRPYRVPCTPSEAIEFIMGSAGKHFDLNVVEAFLSSVCPYPVGTVVTLSNGFNAVIVEENKLNPLRPTVGILDGKDIRIVNLLTNDDYLKVVIKSLYKDDSQTTDVETQE